MLPPSVLLSSLPVVVEAVVQLAGHAVAVAVHVAVVGHHRGVAGVVAVGAQPPGRRAVGCSSLLATPT